MMIVAGSGADKTTVSIGTGNTEFHPYYMFVGNVHNEARRAHGEAVVPVAFLSIPKSAYSVAARPSLAYFQISMPRI
jgi:hypothetical protein